MAFIQFVSKQILLFVKLVLENSVGKKRIFAIHL